MFCPVPCDRGAPRDRCVRHASRSSASDHGRSPRHCGPRAPPSATGGVPSWPAQFRPRPGLRHRRPAVRCRPHLLLGLKALHRGLVLDQVPSAEKCSSESSGLAAGISWRMRVRPFSRRCANPCRVGCSIEQIGPHHAVVSRKATGSRLTHRRTLTGREAVLWWDATRIAEGRR
jgi:hypothetical protein